MFRIVISFIFLLATQSFALDLSKMSAAERALLQEEIRLYLLENPEIIMEAFELLREKEQQAAIKSDLDFKCKSCGEENKLELKGIQNFFT